MSLGAPKKDMFTTLALLIKRRWGRSHVNRLPLLLLTGIYVLLVVGPLIALFLYASPSAIITPTTLNAVKTTLGLTLWTSLIATIASVILGLPTALCLARLQFRGKFIVNALVELPIALPPLVMGVALILMWGRKGIIGHYLAEAGMPLSFTVLAVIIAQFVVASPFFVRIVKASIEQVPIALEEASHTLGVGLLGTYMRVTLPLAARGILAGTLTCWARAMSEFGATVLFAGSFPGRTQTMPLAIYSTMQFDVETSIALALVMLTFSAIAFMLAQAGLRGTIYNGM